MPIHERCPFEKATRYCSIETLKDPSSRSQRSGINERGLGNMEGSLWTTGAEEDIIVPAGTWVPSKDHPPEGARRGSRPTTPCDNRRPSFIVAVKRGSFSNWFRDGVERESISA